MSEQFPHIIKDDLCLIITNDSGATQTITLFDTANFSTTVVVNTYTDQISAGLFPLTNPKFVATDGTIYPYTGVSTKDTLVADLASVGAPTMTYTPLGFAESYSYTSNQSPIVASKIKADGISDQLFTVATSTGGVSGISVELVNMNYNQFTGGLYGLWNTYYIESCAVLATNAVQSVQPFTVTKFQDLFGTQFVQQVVPVLNPNAAQPMTYKVPLMIPLDGNNTIQYRIADGMRVQMVLTARAFGYKEMFNPAQEYISTHVNNIGEYYKPILDKQLDYYSYNEKLAS